MCWERPGRKNGKRRRNASGSWRKSAGGNVNALEAVEEAGFFKRLWHELLMWWQS